jgi:hypothetical protein
LASFRCVHRKADEGRDTGSYVDRGERREVRAWAARTVKRLRLHDTRPYYRPSWTSRCW